MLFRSKNRKMSSVLSTLYQFSSGVIGFLIPSLTQRIHISPSPPPSSLFHRQERISMHFLIIRVMHCSYFHWMASLPDYFWEADSSRTSHWVFHVRIFFENESAWDSSRKGCGIPSAGATWVVTRHNHSFPSKQFNFISVSYRTAACPLMPLSACLSQKVNEGADSDSYHLLLVS